MQDIIEQYKKCVSNKEICYWYMEKDGFMFHDEKDNGWYQAMEMYQSAWYYDYYKNNNFFKRMMDSKTEANLSVELKKNKPTDDTTCWMQCDTKGIITIACSNAKGAILHRPLT